MTSGIKFLQYANTVSFLALTLACLLQWRRRRDHSFPWATGAFGALGALSVIGLALQQPFAGPYFIWLVKGILVMLALCPFFIYRFAAVLEPTSWRLSVPAKLSTAVVIIWSLSIPRLPLPGAPETLWWSAYRWAFVVQWTILFLIVAARLWGGSRHEATVARRRMRTIAVAVAAMNGSLLISGFVRMPSQTITLTTSAIMLVSSFLFFIGLAPPRALLRQWRRPEEIAMRSAMGALVKANSREEMATIFLPLAAGMVAARGAVLTSRDGEVLATYGDVDASNAGVRNFEMRTGTLQIWTSPYAPFFGPDEFAMTESLGAFADIAMERHVLAEASRQAAERFKSLLESAPDAMVIIDHQGVIVLANRQSEQLFGYAATDLVGQPVEILIPQRLRDAHEGHRAAFFGEPRTRQMGQGLELFAVRADGSEVPVEISLSPIDGDEGPLVSAAIRDITERRQRESDSALALADAQQASVLKSTFLANMSHEIRTPMNGVMGMVGLLLDTELDADQRDYIETMAGSAESLLAIIGDILDISKIEAGKVSLEDAPFNLRTAIETEIAPLKLRAREHGVELTVDFAEALPTRVSGDSFRLRQVIGNLVSNAVKFTEAGDVCVTVRPDAGGIHVEVADTGIGITPEQRATLFQPFAQGDSSTTRRYGGTGLGLAICKQLVELMGGRIGLESDAGAGSRFWFTVPLPVVAEPDPTAPVTAHAPTSTGRGRVLVVEDNAVNRKVAVAFLDRLGYQADVASDGIEALDAMDKSRYDVVLMDCQMPRMDGYEAVQHVRAREHNCHTPIVAMTASAMSSDRERCLAAGMDDYLSKPLDREVLSATLERWTSEASVHSS